MQIRIAKQCHERLIAADVEHHLATDYYIACIKNVQKSNCVADKQLWQFAATQASKQFFLTWANKNFN